MCVHLCMTVLTVMYIFVSVSSLVQQESLLAEVWEFLW